MDERRRARYERIYHQLDALITDKSPTLTAAMATLCAVLHAKMPHHFWTGFYFVSREDELHIGPYQGPVACQILRGQGVCVDAVKSRTPIVVPNVEDYPGHIACDARSKSEVVIPLLKDERPIAVLDIDSADLAQFTEIDVAPLQKLVSLLTPLA